MTLYWCEPTAADDVATAGVVDVSLYKRPRSAAGITSFLRRREDVTTTDVTLAFIRTPTSTLIFSGMWYAYATGVEHNYTHRPQTTCDSWPLRRLGTYNCAGAAEFATGRRRVENKTYSLLKMC